MNQIREFINNDFIFYFLLIIIFILSINIFSNFLNNIILLIKNFSIILKYLFNFLLFIPKLFIFIILSPFKFIKWIKELIFIKSLKINNSRNKTL